MTAQDDDFEPESLLRQLAGNWDVRQRMWAGPGGDPIPLPAATARRVLVDGAYLDEDMTPADGAAPFTRHAVLGYNNVNQSFEYFSIDSRLPQMMAYPGGSVHDGELWFTLPAPFVAPAWGDEADVPFAARLGIQLADDGQVVRLHLRRLSAQPTAEFVAFEYLYSPAT